MKMLHTLYYTIFWAWNLAFGALVYVGILPFIAPVLVIATFTGDLPLDFSVALLTLLAVPAVCIWLGAAYFRQQPQKLIQLFYGVEAPLLALCLLRLFVVRELTPASTQIIISLSLCIVMFLVELLDGYATQSRIKAWSQMLIHSLMLPVSLYSGLVMVIYSLPLGWYLGQNFFEGKWLIGLWEIIRDSWMLGGLIWILLGTVLLFFSASLLVFMAPAMGLYFAAGMRVLKQFAAQYGRRTASMGAIAVSMASLVLFLALQPQPQVKAFELLAQPPNSDRDRQSLLAQSDLVRSGLVNAYLSQYRYLSSAQDNNHIQVMYESVLGWPESMARAVQDGYNRLMSPFLYQGAATDVEKAETLYEQFFDTPIQKAERQPVNHALESTWNRDEAKAGLLNFNQTKVWLRSQAVNITEHGDWADVELHEIYTNTTPDPQEVFYSFSLPESAVVTGLWLGDTDDRTKRFPYVVAPRGAAQEVYNSQVQVNRDPALLEQVGPRHYRLRVFPIPVVSLDRTAPKEMHLWLTYQVMRHANGWALPQLGEKRNLFWSLLTQRSRNGQAVLGLDTWLEAYLPATPSGAAQVHQAIVPDRYQVSAQPLAAQDYRLSQNQRFAIVLDSSRSMDNHRQELRETLQWLKQQGFADNQLNNNDADLFITASGNAAPTRLDNLGQFNLDQQVFYGTVQLKDMLRQFTQLRGNTAYDGILVVTDEGSYELSDDSQAIPKMPAPLWMVHLQQLPPAYDDATLQAIEASGGGVSTQVSEVLQRMATRTALGANTINVVDGYAWTMTQVAETRSASDRPGLAPLLARQAILGITQQNQVQGLTDLDRVHTIAQSYSIVTPYSSMLVLVDEAQRQMLKAAEQRSDRFDREVESGKESLTKPHNPLNVATPEPSSWAGVVLAILALLGFRWRQMKHTQL